MYGRFAGLAVAARILREADLHDPRLTVELHGIAARLEAILADQSHGPYGARAGGESLLEWVDD